MKESFYMFSNGGIKRKENNVVVYNSEGVEKRLKIEVLDNIYVFGEVDLNTKLLNFLGQKGISTHFFNYYGFYTGSHYPRKSSISGYMLVNQVRAYDSEEKRLRIAKAFLKAAAFNISRNMKYYNRKIESLNDEIKYVDSLANKIDYGENVNEIMGIEGNIRKIYYESWNKIIFQDINFEKRVKRPPDNMINTLISFVNTLIYTTTLGEIYKTQLSPEISFLHEPGERRFSLSLDISEIFKPLVGDRLIFSLLNRNQITEKDFDKGSEGLHLKTNAKKLIISEYDDRLKKTIKHKALGRSVSYKHLIRLECYKLIKDLIGESEYEGFRIWW